MSTTTTRHGGTQQAFLPADVDATRFAAVEPYFKQLLERPVAGAAELERWVIDRGELEAACSEARANLYITMTCNTDNAEAAKAYERYVEEVAPKLTPAFFGLDKRYVEMAAQFPLSKARYGVYDRAVKAEVELFREENVPLQTELDKLTQKYDHIVGMMTVEFDGQERTMPQMARYQEMTDRAVREKAWKTVIERRMQDREKIDEIFNQQIKIRDRMAKNAGFKDFVGYAFKEKHRFDYGVKECEEFHKGVEVAIVPLMRSVEADRAKLLGVDKLRPWDLSVDVKGRGPLRPFEGGTQLMTKAVNACSRLDPRLGQMLATLGDGANTMGARNGACLDLDSRKGKAPGGYQYMRDRARKPFIFMNAAGLQRDVETMVHEAGHAFHSMLCIDEPLLAYRHSPIEFAEVASMSMELLTMNHWGGANDLFYENEEDFARAKREQLKHSVMLLPWIATIDAFQHWIYTHPMHTPDERRQAWLALDARFGTSASWDGLEQYRPHIWQRQGHLFHHAFYYIEYGIAQLGALQLWLHSLEKGERSAVEAYLAGLRLGGSKPLPELFAAAGLKFEFGPDAIKRIADRVNDELAKLPE